jgi:hypothetical protein
MPNLSNLKPFEKGDKKLGGRPSPLGPNRREEKLIEKNASRTSHSKMTKVESGANKAISKQWP